MNWAVPILENDALFWVVLVGGLLLVDIAFISVVVLANRKWPVKKPGK